jgi:hypothetical protein
MAEKIYVPFEVFQKLTLEEANKLQIELMYIYFKNNPESLRDIIERAEGDPDLVELYKEDEFNKILSRDYAYDINILKKRKNDEIAEKLVEVINDYNARIELELEI